MKRKIKSKPTIDLLSKRFGGKFNITTESQNSFPFDGAFYKPDIVLRDKSNNSIKAIIEVEQASRKNMIGGVITADYCMRKEKNKPIMFVLALHNNDKEDYRKRLPMLKCYSKNFKNIIIDDMEHIIDRISRMH